MPDDSAFFSIAAGLLPTFMLAGVLSERLRPHKSPGGAEGLFWIILVASCFFLVAEVIAIGAAVSGDPSDVARIMVSIALIAAASGAVLLVLLPWIGNVAEEKQPVLIGGLGFVLVVIAIVSMLVLNSAVQNAGRAEETRENLAESRANLAAWDRLLARQRSLYAQEGRLERERTRLLLQEADLLAAPRSPSKRGELFFLRQQIRSVDAQLTTVRDAQRQLRRDFVKLNNETEALQRRVADDQEHE